MKRNGALVVSLDFELFWGVADNRNAREWQSTIENVWNVVPQLLRLFEKYGIHATWATVGGIMAENDEDFIMHLPKKISRPTMEMLKRNSLLTNDETRFKGSMFFAPKLVDMISRVNGQEIGTHTYTHFYCNNPLNAAVEFRADIEAAKDIADRKNVQFASIVFPRNQVNEECLSVISELGICNYRGNESKSWFNRFAKKSFKLFRFFEKADNYIPLVSSKTYPYSDIITDKGLFNIKSSRFFKPFTPAYRLFDWLRILRFKRELRRAARRGEVYHIYWHPHNFANNTERNLKDLENFLKCYEKMRKKYGMFSYNMNEAAKAAAQMQKGACNE